MRNLEYKKDSLGGRNDKTSFGHTFIRDEAKIPNLSTSIIKRRIPDKLPKYLLKILMRLLKS